MIDLGQFVNGIAIGVALIALGLKPSLLQGLAGRLDDLASQMAFRFPVQSGTALECKRQPWLTALGAAIIILAFAAFFAH